MEKANVPPSRRWLFLTILAVIALGLGSRRYPHLLRDLFADHPGDVLWAVTLYLGLTFLKPAASRYHLALVALLIAYCVEFAQLYQAPWINAVRANPFGHLLLGSTFVATDLLAYTIGICLGVLLVPVLPSARSRPINGVKSPQSTS